MQVIRSWTRWAALIVLLAIVAAVSVLGSAVTVPKIPGWYASLNKPAFNPPAWVFGPVWTALYVMMAVAAWRVWLQPAIPERRTALAWFALQLALNAAWSQVFFGLERPGWALAVIVALVVAVAVTLWRFFRLDRLAGWLLAPYLAWLLFATVLNGAVVALN
ncbi:MAG TPA: TspO/MBR family protein [Xanthobacteraceae bacterium]|nr:TspO/MBR family protein [Xanthobacteraceae bacterium]